MSWSPDDIPSQDGRIALVTGANSGIGYAASLELARRGARVVLACRSPDRGQAALARIAANHPQAQVSLLQLDLSDLGSVAAAAERFRAEHDRLDLLINNAGVMALPRMTTADGFEMQIGTNHFGHFALTMQLLERLLAAPGSRVVTVSSLAHRFGRVRFHDLDGERRYHKWQAYGQSKLANLLFAYELERRLAGHETRSVACHPGYAATNLQSVGPRLEGSRVAAAMMRLSNATLAQSSERGAWPTLYAATAPEVNGGDFIGPSGPLELAGPPGKVHSSTASHDREVAARLWQVSVERTGVDDGALFRG